MSRSSVNWKWPKDLDEMFYDNEDIQQKIASPVQLNQGVMEVPELKGKWG